jgi:hypothetical protein
MKKEDLEQEIEELISEKKLIQKKWVITEHQKNKLALEKENIKKHINQIRIKLKNYLIDFESGKYENNGKEFYRDVIKIHNELLSF